ncbi:MAG: tRNA-dihydrouridine synthase family protein [Pseudobdellovibrio sp.]|nr:tRNA-dihydrouridine synthase family protein [Pseudobdellovibrio sp.]
MQFSFPLCLAPMVGLSHVVLRKIVYDYLPQDQQTIWPTEMLNSRRVPQEKLGFTAETLLHEGERNLVPQILGNDKEMIQLTIRKMINEWGDINTVSGIDINMGCPVQKALRHNYGVALMGDLNYAAQVVEFAATASNKPVSVKLRAVGSDKSVLELIHFVKTLRDAGAKWITLHPRTAEQKRRGQADWNQITELKKALDIPIIGNGDIQTADDVFSMLEQTGCDLVMSGRGLAARPWMMWQVAYRKGLTAEVPPMTEYEEGAEYGKMLLKFIHLSRHYFCEKLGHKPDYAFRKIQFFVRTTHVWLEWGHPLTSEINRSQTFEEMIERVEKFFSQPHRMVPYTELRQ